MIGRERGEGKRNGREKGRRRMGNIHYLFFNTTWKESLLSCFVCDCLQLWPLFGGRLVKPHRSKLFYVPQRPYMTLGTLRDQVIYPDTVTDQTQKGISDDDLADFLDKVNPIPTLYTISYYHVTIM